MCGGHDMTRQKDEIANGVRLEKASWRTWWKQRNKLKTISPETLIWYVLWFTRTCVLPLPFLIASALWLTHTYIFSFPTSLGFTVPYILLSTGSHSLSLRATLPSSMDSPQDRSGLSSASDHPSQLRSKPILKHRSISDLLTGALPDLNQTNDNFSFPCLSFGQFTNLQAVPVLFYS